MGRAFEYRKARKLKRWGNMSRTFTRLGKEITIAAKGGTDPDNNPRLRALIQNARVENMPKDNIDRAIKRAVEKDQSDYKELAYEGYGPHGIALMVDTATDNPTRTVANLRNYFSKCGGALGTSGSVGFMFDHKCVFRVKPKDGINLDELELELIDYGVDELFADENEWLIYGAYESYGGVQKYFEDGGYEIVSSNFERIPTDTKEVTPDQQAAVEKLVERIEDDEDVQAVWHNMRESE
ncbi:MAG: YebC/PmpR family DNA-binding transcriptional regulator [Prevotellaceae bacterium]|jgi:YebC/PmpR family DNA-binding regulatory protein|nr:YebC/PmpR family DNA-binding transcriptional regulator [Prevotellaceae bacterium]